MMTRHRIVGCEADRPKPLAYLRVFPGRGRATGGYLVAAAVGALLTLAAGVAVAILSGVIGAS